MDYFLATTALHQFWHKDKSLLLLGPWCLRPSHADAIEHSTYEILPDPWQTIENLHNARTVVEQTYAKLLPDMAKILNLIHKQDHSIHYWEIIVGSWLRYYISIIYDRFTCLTHAYQNHSNLSTRGLDVTSYFIPENTHDFLNYLSTDIYNLQIYSKILDFLGQPFEKITVDVKAMLDNQQPNVTIMHHLKKIIRRVANHCFLYWGHGSCVVMADMGISFLTLIKFFIQSKRKIVPLTFFAKPIPYTINLDQRMLFERIPCYESSFVNCLIKLLPYFIPVCFIETHAHLKKSVDVFPLSPRTLVSSMGWHMNEPFKCLAAKHHAAGGILCSHQHGGDYGILAYHPSQMHEMKVVDRFYSWGAFQPTTKKPCIIPLTSLKLRDGPKRRKSIETDQLLYGITSSYRYLLRFTFSISQFMHYLQMQNRFIVKLSPDLRKKMHIRLYHADWGWDRIKRFQASGMAVNLQSPRIPFRSALANCKIYITDHISTTFIESLAANTPTIIFCEPAMWELHPNVIPYFKALKTAGILFHQAEYAAQFLNDHYADLDTWWFAPERQAVVEKFCHHFGRSASHDLSEWIHELSFECD